jgi:hypothetical protein
MVVASCRSIFLLSNVVFNRASVSFRFSTRVFLSISGRVCSGFLGQPLARPLSLSHFRFPLSNFPLPLFHLLCPRCDLVDGYRRSSDSKESFPSPSSLPPLLSLFGVRDPPAPSPRAPERPRRGLGVVRRGRSVPRVWPLRGLVCPSGAAVRPPA